MVPLRAADRTAITPPASPMTTAVPRIAARPQWDDRRARRRASATTFGLTGRVLITGGLAVGLVVVAVGNLFGVPFYLAFMAWALRDTWAKGGRPAPLPPREPRPAARVARDAAATLDQRGSGTDGPTTQY